MRMTLCCTFLLLCASLSLCAQEATADTPDNVVPAVAPAVPGVLSSTDASAPFKARQKFELAWKKATDPSTFVITGLVAGFEQERNELRGYGQGSAGYAKRYAAEYADFFSANMLSHAVFPVLLKQDPRYFVKGNGSKMSRIGYALANAVICKGDNGRWQPKYSSFLGNVTSVGLSNLYYPAGNRLDPDLSAENFGINIGAEVLSNLYQEFFCKRLAFKAHH